MRRACTGRMGGIIGPAGWVLPARLASIVSAPGVYSVKRRQHTIDGREVGMPEHEETEAVGTAEQLVAETLVEEVSVDGMCGVY